jgi:hypothetical protein
LFFLAGVIALPVSQAQGRLHGKAHNEYPGKHWTQAAKPEDRGWSSDGLAAAKAYADASDTAAVIIVDDGVVVSQKDQNDRCYSSDPDMVVRQIVLLSG